MTTTQEAGWFVLDPATHLPFADNNQNNPAVSTVPGITGADLQILVQHLHCHNSSKIQESLCTTWRFTATIRLSRSAGDIISKSADPYCLLQLVYSDTYKEVIVDDKTCILPAVARRDSPTKSDDPSFALLYNEHEDVYSGIFKFHIGCNSYKLNNKKFCLKISLIARAPKVADQFVMGKISTPFATLTKAKSFNKLLIKPKQPKPKPADADGDSSSQQAPAKTKAASSKSAGAAAANQAQPGTGKVVPIRKRTSDTSGKASSSSSFGSPDSNGHQSYLPSSFASQQHYPHPQLPSIHEGGEESIAALGLISLQPPPPPTAVPDSDSAMPHHNHTHTHTHHHHHHVISPQQPHPRTSPPTLHYPPHYPPPPPPYPPQSITTWPPAPYPNNNNNNNATSNSTSTTISSSSSNNNNSTTSSTIGVKRDAPTQQPWLSNKKPLIVKPTPIRQTPAEDLWRAGPVPAIPSTMPSSSATSSSSSSLSPDSSPPHSSGAPPSMAMGNNISPFPFHHEYPDMGSVAAWLSRLDTSSLVQIAQITDNILQYRRSTATTTTTQQQPQHHNVSHHHHLPPPPPPPLPHQQPQQQQQQPPQKLQQQPSVSSVPTISSGGDTHHHHVLQKEPQHQQVLTVDQQQ